MTNTCTSDPCESTLAGEEPDMRMGDTCLMCLARGCERCGQIIGLDEENQICPPPIHDKGARVPIPKQEGYIDVCDDCLLDTDVLYDDELEAERRDPTPWHDGPNDYFLADPAGGGKWIKEKKAE